MPLPSHIPTAVIGGGHAGLGMSHQLAAAGRDHVVLERRTTPGGSWQDRWDAFRLVTPNWCASFPGQPYDGGNPDGYMARDEVVQRIADYTARSEAPIAFGIDVQRLEPKGSGGFRLVTNDGTLQADEVVVAIGSYHRPRVPALASDLGSPIFALHSHAYRNPSSLPPGGVLIVGSGQTGVQLADELQRAGRQVFLSVGSNPSAPRRYRGRDLFWWLWHLVSEGAQYGIDLPTADRLPDPRMRLMGTPQLTGHHGGQDVDLRRMAAEGRVTLLGHVQRIDGTRVSLDPDLGARLARADQFFDRQVRPAIDGFIAASRMQARPEERATYPYEPPERTEIDLLDQGISTVLWATGYAMDYSWIRAPITDDLGIPRQVRGVSTDVPGLYFIGLLWQHSQASATLAGPMLDAPYLLEQMGLTETAVAG